MEELQTLSQNSIETVVPSSRGYMERDSAQDWMSMFLVTCRHFSKIFGFSIFNKRANAKNRRASAEPDVGVCLQEASGQMWTKEMGGVVVCLKVLTCRHLSRCLLDILGYSLPYAFPVYLGHYNA